MTTLHLTLAEVTARIKTRSQQSRAEYLARIAAARASGPVRQRAQCANFAHAFAALPTADKAAMHGARQPNIGIVTAYNDMLSAHQPYASYPEQIKAAARAAGAVAQVAGGVPAMCDGVTQGEPGMELSLFSRDVIAMGTALALSHNVFDAALCLGICDKIVPGLLIGALSFGHLPTIFVPAGPMTSGLGNAEKAKVRQQFAEGKVGRETLLASESAAYHAAGTCTFYGTANTNQMMMELLGLHLPGAAFVNPGTPLRTALTDAAAQQAARLAVSGDAIWSLGEIVDERAIVNALVGLLATGGSTNHTIHLVAIARAAGIVIDWDDFSALSAAVPLLARIYPNGAADVNQFHAAGGMGFLVRELLAAGLLHADVQTVVGMGLHHYGQEPWLNEGQLAWRDAPAVSGNEDILRPAARPFSNHGGLQLIKGNLGRGVIKTSAVKPEHRAITAPARVFNSQQDLLAAYKRGELARDFIAVLRYQGPRANGMPELHNLMPALGALQDAGHKVALVTDGRMSGASGKVPSAIHMSPEALAGGPLARVCDGDLLSLDGEAGTLELLQICEDAERPAAPHLDGNHSGTGRELFSLFRNHARSAEEGASALF